MFAFEFIIGFFLSAAIMYLMDIGVYLLFGAVFVVGVITAILFHRR